MRKLGLDMKDNELALYGLSQGTEFKSVKIGAWLFRMNTSASSGWLVLEGLDVNSFTFSL